MTFRDHLERQPLDRWAERIEGTVVADVQQAIEAPPGDFDAFLSLISPAAAPQLEALAARARHLTRQRFGRVVQMYAPLYVSNLCTNGCRYCGFSHDNHIRRTTLTLDEAETEAEALWKLGFRSILLVSGEAPAAVPVSYFTDLTRRLRRRFASISVEIYPLDETGYAELVAAGVDGLALYQETYDPELYAEVHPSGPKADYGWRLEGPGRGASAGMRRVGLGALLGLGPWRREAAALAQHALWLQHRFWETQVCVSFPRLRPATGGFPPRFPVSDRDLAQLSFALRLLMPDAGLVLSTRENAAFRDGLAPLCVTHLSAGSRTEPGGYTHPDEAESQFAIDDTRTPAQVCGRLVELGVEPVWKDWDAAFLA